VRGNEVEKELQFHIDERIDDLIGAGIAPDDARRRARLEFGGVLQMREACDDERQGFVSRLGQDIPYALRMMRRSPGFTFVVVLCLALGIGANTAIFSVIDNLMFRPPPFRNIDRLVALYDTHPQKCPPTRTCRRRQAT
jgi:hypothetical protein